MAAVCVAAAQVYVAALLLYFIEGESKPAQFGSITRSLWWAIVTLTTVGYGDVFPITALGKILGAIISILGIGVFALPTGILAVSFVEEIQKHKTKKGVCPHCGKEIEY
jgi:voltage-gated potassium channel